MPKANHTDAPATNHPGLWSRLSTLQRLAAIASVVVMVSAIGLQVVASTTTPDRPAPTSSPTRAPTPEGLVQGFGAAETPPARTTEDTDTTEDHPLDQWSPAIFRMGFSFFVGFAIAFALRTFVRLSLIAIGVFFLALFGLQYAGFIEVNWNAIGDRYDSTQSWLSAQFSSFVDFATGYLPSGAAFAAGLVLGFRRKT